ncbi:MAG TPA: 16S rRNA (guanine(527)-N(7))-methyltransferase RsmG [Soehngenia sp.]|nr:16S rRNA (guanine(527)-N(7))-methyltransferase RsmG [Soehngenia sp.]
MTNSVFINSLKELGLVLSNDALQKYEIYKDMLVEWNKKFNITTITEEDEIYIKHFCDSLSLVNTKLFDEKKRVIDIGTGGGFPGLVLKIYNEELDMTLMDSLNKRIVFLNEVIKELKLSNVKAIHARAEELGVSNEHREKYDIAVSRAVASLNTLSEYCLPFVKVGGYFIAMKGPDVKEEVEESKNAIKLLGGELERIEEIKLPFLDITHTLIMIKKVKQTPNKYPRQQGKPKKNPL